MKKAIDKPFSLWYNVQALPQKGESTTKIPQKTFKKVEKTFAKGIDKEEEMWYNSRAAAKAVANDP